MSKILNQFRKANTFKVSNCGNWATNNHFACHIDLLPEEVKQAMKSEALLKAVLRLKKDPDIILQENGPNLARLLENRRFSRIFKQTELLFLNKFDITKESLCRVYMNKSNGEIVLISEALVTDLGGDIDTIYGEDNEKPFVDSAKKLIFMPVDTSFFNYKIKETPPCEK